MNLWDTEYNKGGIPSSYRNEPSGVLNWALNNWYLLTGKDKPVYALDVGCGTGRNSLYLASIGIEVFAFDLSEKALQLAHERLDQSEVSKAPVFLKHDLANGLPIGSSQADFVSDIFVYKHQLLPSIRTAYRQELRRVLKPEGRLLLSLASKEDGYYSSCPNLEISEPGNPQTVLDPVIGVGSVLFNLEELIIEMSDVFQFEMAWHKAKLGSMHGQEYKRHTLATVWCLRKE